MSQLKLDRAELARFPRIVAPVSLTPMGQQVAAALARTITRMAYRP